MASPQDADRATTSISSASGSWNVNLPGTISAGDVLLMYARLAGNVQISASPPSGWTQLYGASPDAADDWNYVFVRLADGTEGATMTLTPDASIKGSTIVWRITAAESPAIQAPELTVATSAASNIDPPSITPTGGPKDFLYIILGGCDGETQTFVHGSYANVTNQNSGTGGAVASNCRIGGASLTVGSSTTQDPPAWAVAAPNSGATAITVAIHPPAPSVPGPVHRRFRRADRFLTVR